MYLIVGLGNPGSKYDKTRHNAGFDAIDYIASKYNIDITKNEKKGLTGRGIISGQKVLLVKPQTFMNCSGQCVAELSEYYDIDPTTELIVLSDDVTLAPGNIRIRKKGSAGGHNGLKDIIAWTDTQEFMRVRIGVGEVPEKGDMVNHVLGHFSKEDREALEGCFDNVCSAVELMIADDIEGAMNAYNSNKNK